jgi:hypothetical protein
MQSYCNFSKKIVYKKRGTIIPSCPTENFKEVMGRTKLTTREK